MPHEDKIQKRKFKRVGNPFRKPKGEVKKEFPEARIRVVERGKVFDVKLSPEMESQRIKLSPTDKLIARLRAIGKVFRK